MSWRNSKGLFQTSILVLTAALFFPEFTDILINTVILLSCSLANFVDGCWVFVLLFTLRYISIIICCLKFEHNVPVNSKTAHPPPRAIPGHLTRVKLRTVGNLTQNEARPLGHLTFVSKRLSAVGSKRISQFFDSAGEPRSRVIALVDSTWVFLLLSFYIVLSWNMPLF